MSVSPAQVREVRLGPIARKKGKAAASQTGKHLPCRAPVTGRKPPGLVLLLLYLSVCSEPTGSRQPSQTRALLNSAEIWQAAFNGSRSATRAHGERPRLQGRRLVRPQCPRFAVVRRTGSFGVL